jgi:hypothetical protein
MLRMSDCIIRGDCRPAGEIGHLEIDHGRAFSALNASLDHLAIGNAFGACYAHRDHKKVLV